MNLLGVIPVLAAVLLGPSAGAHSAISDAGSDGLVQTTPAPVLQQLAHNNWQTTVLVSGLGSSGCPDQKTDGPHYILQTTSPAVDLSPTKVAPGGSSAAAGSCSVTLTFPGPDRVPTSATLVFNGTSTVTLTVSRQTGLAGYLALPAIFGGAAALFLLAGCAIWVQVYDENGRKKKRRDGRWRHPVSATGAWTINDSWATNIATLVAVVGTVLGASSAAGELFPGADINKFVIVIDIAGAIATAVPLLFAVLYAWWTARQPGLTEDSSLWLTATLNFDATASSAPNGPGVPARPIGLASGTQAIVPGTSKVALASDVHNAVLVPGTVVTLLPGAWLGHWRRRIQLDWPVQARLPASTTVTLGATTVITPVAAELTLAEVSARVSLPPGTEVILPAGITAELAARAGAVLPGQAAINIPLTAEVLVDKVEVVLPEGTIEGAGPGGTRVLLGDGERARIGGIDYGRSALLQVPFGAAISVPWGATACASALKNGSTQPARLEAGGSIQIPPDSRICILGGLVTLPGTADILVRGDSILVILSDAGSLDVKPSPAPAAGSGPDSGVTSLTFPVRLSVRDGTKITVTGVAKFYPPAEEVTVTAPRREPFPLSAASARVPIRVPQGANTLVGPLWAVIAAAVVTTFSVGAQLGIAALLTMYLSGTNDLGLALTWLILAGLVLFTVWYGVTAIRALVDPQPGSSMSSTAGTSFTL